MSFHSFRVTDSWDESPGSGGAGVTPFDGDVAFITGDNNYPTTLYDGDACALTISGTSYCYVAGGIGTGGLEVPTVRRSTLHSTTGQNGTWSTMTSLAVSPYRHTMVGSGSNLWLIGGQNNLTGVYKGAVDGSGNITAWTAQTSLPAGMYNHGSCIVGNYIYAIGGSGASGATTVYYADISGGSISSWSTATAGLPAGRTEAAVTTDGTNIWVTMGFSGGATGTIYVATPSSGNITSWATADTHTVVRYNHAAGFIQNYLYVISGYVSPTTSVRANKRTGATLDDDFTSTSIAEQRRHAQWFTFNNRIYIIGGIDGDLTIRILEAA